MPVTKTAKRALRGSAKKEKLNLRIISDLEVAIRLAKKTASKENILRAISISDKAAKRHSIHRNKASKIKATLSKLLPKITSKKTAKKPSSKK